MVGGGSGQASGGSGSIMEALLTLLLSDRLGLKAFDQSERSPEVEALRAEIRKTMQKPEAGAGTGTPA